MNKKDYLVKGLTFVILEIALFCFGSLLMKAVEYNTSHIVFHFGGCLVWLSLMIPAFGMIGKLILLVFDFFERGGRNE